MFVKDIGPLAHDPGIETCARRRIILILYLKNAQLRPGNLAFFLLTVMPGAESGSTIALVKAAGSGQSTGSRERL